MKVGSTVQWRKRGKENLAKNEARVKFTAETQSFTAQIKSANSTITALRAGLKLNEAELKNNGDKAEYLQNKHKILESELDASRSKQEALSQKLEAAKRIYGENSEEVQQWQTKLTRARTEEQQLQTQISACEQEMEAQREETERSESALEQLNSEMANQQQELQRLRTEYMNVALGQGDNSEEAQRLRTEITNLNTELQQNEQRLESAAQALDETREAAEESGESAGGAANGGWSVAKQILANLASETLSQLKDALIEAGKAMVQNGMDFTASLSNVQGLSEATADEMEQLEAAAKALGRSTIFSATDVADAFGYMALAGWDTSEMLDGVDGVLNLAAASQMDLAKASDIVTDYLTAFGLSAADSGKFVDQMAYAMSHSNTNTEQLGEAYKNCAATASSMGYTVEDTTAALMTMANAGVKGGEAGTGLSTIMTRLATNTKDCADELSEYGVEVYNSEGEMNSLSSILNGCAGIWKDLTDEEGANLAKMIAGTSQYSKFQTVMQGLSESAIESGSSFNDYTEALKTCDGAASDMAATMQDNLTGDITAASSAMEGLGQQVFTYVEGPLRGVVQGVTDIINGITDSITPQKTVLEEFIDDIAQGNAEVQASLDNANTIMQNAGSDVAKMEAYKKVLLDLNTQESLTEFQKYQIANAVEELSDKVPGLSKVFDEAKGVLTVTNEELEEMFTNSENLVMQTALLETKKEAQYAASKADIEAAMAASALETALTELEVVEGDQATLTERLTNGTPAYTKEVFQAREAVREAEKQQKAANEELEAAQTALNETEKGLKGLEEEYGLTAETTGKASGEMVEATEGVVTATKEMSEEMEKEYNKMYESISESISGSTSMLKEFSGGTEITAQQIKDNLDSQIKGIGDWSANLQRLAGEAGSGMTQELYDYLVQLGPESANLVQTLVNSLEDKTGDFQAICQRWTEALKLQADVDILTDYTHLGAGIKDATVSGMEGTETEIKEKMQNSVNAAANIDTSVATPKGSGMVSDFCAGVEQRKSLVEKTMSELAGTGAKSADGQKDAYKTAGDNAGTAYTESVENSYKTIETSANDMVLTFQGAVTRINMAVESCMNKATRTVTDEIEEMKRAFNFTWKLPYLAMPHITIRGSFSVDPPKAPTFDVSWYAKGAVFKKPTIFNTPYGLKGFGEAGAEFAAPVDVLHDYVTDAALAVANQVETIDYDVLADKVARACSKMNISLKVGNRDFGRMVREVR